jgi:hypothetical protein
MEFRGNVGLKIPKINLLLKAKKNFNVLKVISFKPKL